MGRVASRVIQLLKAREQLPSQIGSVVGIVVLLFGACFWSFTTVLGGAVLLLVSLVISTAFAARGRFLSGSSQGGEASWPATAVLFRQSGSGRALKGVS